MALRNSPYLPLYVQDFMTDEKLAECSAHATGIYIRVMCLLHKGNPYGTFLLKQNFKQNASIISNFAYNLARHLPYSIDEIEIGLIELLDNNILTIDGDLLFQKRMLRDGEISEIRSKSGSKGGNPIFKKGNICLTKNRSKIEAKAQANYDIDIDIEDDIIINNRANDINYIDIINYWNNKCKSYPSVNKLTEKRKKSIRNLIKNCHTNIEEIKKAMDMLEEADDFWKGENEREWKATFDWFISDTKGCFARILEGGMSKSPKETIKKTNEGDWQS